MAHLSNKQRRTKPRPSGTARAASHSPYDAVTEKIIEALARGVVPWRRPWQDALLPCNAISRKRYRGINMLLLSLAPYQDHRWLTFRQAKQLGGHIRHGERSTLVVFWKPLVITPVDAQTGVTERLTIPLLRHYHVFNVEQCEGLDIPPADASKSQNGSERIERAEAVVRAMPNPPMIRVGGSVASYRPREDLVQIPGIGLSQAPDSYYATLFHELGHATGHETRLNRTGMMAKAEFGSRDYSREELVAELASAFCSAVIGLDNSLLDGAAGYVKNWLEVLQDDPKALVVAAAQGQRAADYIRGVTTEASEDS
jgi:antirestriction protein ArdC